MSINTMLYWVQYSKNTAKCMIRYMKIRKGRNTILISIHSYFFLYRKTFLFCIVVINLKNALCNAII